MKYINERILLELGANWKALINVIEEATIVLKAKQISQPIKPYLRFNNPINRIIAMPAFLGGNFKIAGIKWIASFPENIKRSIKRAHAVIILNDTETGAPTTLVNTALISGIRTAAVSGFILKKYMELNKVNDLSCGIIGFGPIGQLHLQMLEGLLGDNIKNVFIYDLNKIDRALISGYKKEIIICNDWREVYEKSSIFITCTVSSQRYVDMKPKKGGVYINVSLRDFQTDFLKSIDVNVVDNWEEICRENTDIENAHKQFGLSKSSVFEITDVFTKEIMSSLETKSFMFNPMGMAIYDVAIAKYYSDLAEKKNNYIELED